MIRYLDKNMYIGITLPYISRVYNTSPIPYI